MLRCFEIRDVFKTISIIPIHVSLWFFFIELRDDKLFSTLFIERRDIRFGKHGIKLFLWSCMCYDFDFNVKNNMDSLKIRTA